MRLDHRCDGPARAAAARVGLGRLHAPLAAATSRSPTTAPRPWPTTRRSASRRRSIRGCRAAAATWCPACTTSCPAQVQRSRQLPRRTRRTTVTSRRCTTAIDINIARPDAEGLPAPGRQHHRAARDGLLRGAGSSCRSRTGAFSTGSELPAFSPTNPYCHYAPGIDTRYTGVGTYTVPKVDVLFSAALTSSAGIPLRADWTRVERRRRAVARPAALGQRRQRDREPAEAGRHVGATGSTSSTSASRRSCGSGRTRANIALDLFNALNLNTILVPNQAFIPGGAWLAPTGTQTPVMTARTAKITVQYDF